MNEENSEALVADIGGSNARFAIADLASLRLRDIITYPASRFASLPEAASTYLASTRHRPRLACLAVAGPLTGERITMTNLPWTFTRTELREATAAEHLVLAHDFAALARSIPSFTAADLCPIDGEGSKSSAAGDSDTRLVLGPGTGLGMCGLICTDSSWLTVTGEGGHATLPIRTARELEIRQQLGADGTHVSAENVISGPGLVRLHQALAAIEGQAVQDLSPERITALALSGTDAIAAAALAQFIEWLACLAGDMALAFGARGGVYLGGGIVPHILPMLRGGNFRAAFAAKGEMSAYLQSIPLHVILAGDAALRGAALILIDEIARAERKGAE